MITKTNNENVKVRNTEEAAKLRRLRGILRSGDPINVASLKGEMPARLKRVRRPS